MNLGRWSLKFRGFGFVDPFKKKNNNLQTLTGSFLECIFLYVEWRSLRVYGDAAVCG